MPSALKRFGQWLKGTDYRRLTVNMDIFCRKLDFQRRQLEVESKRNREKALQYRKEGNDAAFKMYVEQYLRYQKWALGVDVYRLRIEGMLFRLRQSQMAKDIAGILGSVKATLKDLRVAVNVPDIAEMVNGIEKELQHVELAQEVTESGVDRAIASTIVTPEDITLAMEQIDAEVEATTALPVPKGKESELEKEIKKLKESNV
nr:Snf7 family protein [Candidatus Njordarchaeum guaymaensis]